MIVRCIPDGGDEIGGRWVPVFKLSREDVLRQRVHLVDGVLTHRKTGNPVKLCADKDGYLKFTLSISHNSAIYYAAHRAIWFLHYGEWPKHTIDHINFDRADNRIENLRDIPRQENVGRRRPLDRSFVSNSGGVHKVEGPRRTAWNAQIQYKGQRYWLGTFRSEEAARAARRAAEQALADGKRPLTVSKGRTSHNSLGVRPNLHRKASV